MVEVTTLQVTPERLRELLTDVEADFGHDYGIAAGLAALRELRRLIGGETHANWRDDG